MRTTGRTPGYLSREYFPLAVKWLLISNIAVYVVYFFAARSEFASFFSYLKLVPSMVLPGMALWQLVTYMWLHNAGDPWHIIINMLMLYMCGADLERQWGWRQFMRYYMLCGVGAGICVVIANTIAGTNTPTIGASGAIFGLILAYGVVFADRIVLFNLLFPIKAKYFAMIYGGIAFLFTFGSSGGAVSHVAHLGGMVFGYVYLKSWGTNIHFLSSLKGRYHQWRIDRAKRKFQVYMRKHDRDRTIH